MDELNTTIRTLWWSECCSFRALKQGKIWRYFLDIPSCHFSAVAQKHGTHRMGGYVESRAILNALQKGNLLLLQGIKSLFLFRPGFARVLYNRPAVLALIPHITDSPRLVQ
jgi:hypothetical protein